MSSAVDVAAELVFQGEPPGRGAGDGLGGVEAMSKAEDNRVCEPTRRKRTELNGVPSLEEARACGVVYTPDFCSEAIASAMTDRISTLWINHNKPRKYLKYESEAQTEERKVISRLAKV